MRRGRVVESMDIKGLSGNEQRRLQTGLTVQTLGNCPAQGRYLWIRLYL